jgi:hypothetical protein
VDGIVDFSARGRNRVIFNPLWEQGIVNCPLLKRHGVCCYEFFNSPHKVLSVNALLFLTGVFKTVYQ